MTEKQERLVKAYDSEAWPLYGQRFAELIGHAFVPTRAVRILVVGGATGLLPLSLARALDPLSRLTVLESSPVLAAQARRRAASDPAMASRINVIETAGPGLPPDIGTFDRVVVNGAVADVLTGPQGAVDLARVLRPTGQLVAALPLRGTWAEVLDIYRDVLRDNRKLDGLAALEAYVEGLPADDAPAAWMERAGLRDVRMQVERWSLLFKTAREFFFAPVIEQGPLLRWKQIAGRGDEMQDIFFFIKEAIDAYFAGSVFAVSVVAGCVQATKV